MIEMAEEREILRLHAELCKMLSNPVRLEILNLLRDGEKTVSELVAATSLRQANLSQHLAPMRQRGVVLARKDGTNVYYRIANQKLVRACELIREALFEHLAKTGELISRAGSERKLSPPHKFDPRKTAMLDDPERRKWQDVKAFLRILGPRLGMVYADLGCGTGYFTLPVAERVGPNGKVYAVDIQPEMLKQLKSRVKAKGLTNVKTLLCSENKIPLPSSSLDAANLANTFHELTRPHQFLKEVHRILKPNGRLILIDWKAKKTPFGPSLRERVPLKNAIKILQAAGFDSWHEHRGYRYHYVVETKKKDDNMSEDEKLKSILGCRTVAVVGLSRDPSKGSHGVASYLEKNGYRIIPVNPFAEEILGEKCYKSLLEIPIELQKKIEIIDIFRPSEDVPPIVEQAVELKRKYGKLRAVWMQLGIENEGAAEHAMREGLEVVMNRCMMQEHIRLM